MNTTSTNASAMVIDTSGEKVADAHPRDITQPRHPDASREPKSDRKIAFGCIENTTTANININLEGHHDEDNDDDDSSCSSISSGSSCSSVSSCDDEDDDAAFFFSSSPSAAAPAKVEDGRRCVRFNEEVNVRCIEHVNELSEERVAAIWYHKQEYSAMKQECRDLIEDAIDSCSDEKVLQGKLLLRGIEHHLPTYSRRRNQRIHSCIDGVLDEQEHQMEHGSADASFLASLCSELSRYSCQLARSRGVQDAQVAKQVQTTGMVDSSHSVKRTVHFSDLVFVKPYVHFKDFSEDEISQSWYQKEDYTSMKEHRRMVAKYFVKKEGNKKPKLISEFCRRGVEPLLPLEGGRRKINKTLGWETVLEEQERQHLTHATKIDYTMIAQEYRKGTMHCEVEARYVGHQDEKDIAEYMADCRTLYSRYLSSSKSKVTKQQHGDSQTTDAPATAQPMRAPQSPSNTLRFPNNISNHGLKSCVSPSKAQSDFAMDSQHCHQHRHHHHHHASMRMSIPKSPKALFTPNSSVALSATGMTGGWGRARQA